MTLYMMYKLYNIIYFIFLKIYIGTVILILNMNKAKQLD